MSDEAVSEKIKDGMRLILACITRALKRARERQMLLGTGTNDPMYRYLSGQQNRNGMFSVVRRLASEDADFVTDGGDVLREWDCIEQNRKKSFNKNVRTFFNGGETWVWWSDEVTE